MHKTTKTDDYSHNEIRVPTVVGMMLFSETPMYSISRRNLSAAAFLLQNISTNAVDIATT